MTRRILYTPTEVGEMIGSSSTCVRNWCRLGIIPAFKINGSWRVPAATVEALATGTLDIKEPIEQVAL